MNLQIQIPLLSSRLHQSKTHCHLDVDHLTHELEFNRSQFQLHSNNVSIEDSPLDLFLSQNLGELKEQEMNRMEEKSEYKNHPKTIELP